jgi:hypothetical protein
MFLTYIFRNANIPKDKKLADKIVHNANPDYIYAGTIGNYLRNFASVLKPEELENSLSKLIGEKFKSSTISALETKPDEIIAELEDEIDILNTEYGSGFKIENYPTLKFLKDMVDEAKRKAKEVFAESRSQDTVRESRFKKLNRIGRYSMLR